MCARAYRPRYAANRLAEGGGPATGATTTTTRSSGAGNGGGGATPRPEMLPAVRARLSAFYAPFNAQLAQLLGDPGFTAGWW